jgi:hypothetical protein
MKKVYISCPVSISQNQLKDIRLAACKNNTINAYYWQRNGSKSYSTDLVTTADAVVIVHPNNSFKFDKLSLPVGVLKEYNLAVKFNKPIYLAYQSSYGWNMYEIEDLLGRIEARSGTSNTYYNQLVSIPNTLDNLRKSS